VERKQRWLEKQPARFQNLTFEPVMVNWRKIGLKWGFFMYLVMGVGFPILFPVFVEGINYDRVFNFRYLLLMMAFTLPLFTLGGLLFGFMMKRSMEKKGIPPTKKTE